MIGRVENCDPLRATTQELSQMTSINAEDIKTTLQYLGLVKYWYSE